MVDVKMNEQRHLTVEEISAEVTALRQDLEGLRDTVQANQAALQRLIHVFNERMTDVYGELDHIKQQGSDCSTIPRQTTILRNFFVHG